MGLPPRLILDHWIADRQGRLDAHRRRRGRHHRTRRYAARLETKLKLKSGVSLFSQGVVLSNHGAHALGCMPRFIGRRYVEA